MEKVSRKTPAKINLFLRVLGRREDGYHDIESLMVPIGLYDTVEINFDQDSLSVCCPGFPSLDGPENVAYKAAKAFFAAAAHPQQANITIYKNIPIEAGLGGGSSDAGMVLRILHSAYPVISKQKIYSLASSLGADISFFLQDSPSLISGIGEQLHPVQNLPDFWVILACAPFGLSTRMVYQNLKLPLTRRPDSGREVHSGPGWDWNFLQLASNLTNDLQPTGEEFHPVIGKVCDQLLRAGAAGACMSGSGPTVFGLFPTQALAQNALERLEREHGWNYLVARGMTAGKNVEW